jgi:hypothetical protein
MDHADPPDHERIRDKGPVTMPGIRFRAHDDNRSGQGQLHQAIKMEGKFTGLHIIRVTAERIVVPSPVPGLFRV